MDYVENKDVEKLNLRIGKVKAAENHPKTNDFILLIDLGPVERDMQLVADLKDGYKMEELIGKQVVFLENFKPKMVRGIESQGLLLITHREGKPVLLQPEKDVLTGVKVFGLNDLELAHYIKQDVE